MTVLANRRRSRDAAQQEEECCWICLEGPSAESPLARPCHCPRDVHLKCLSRWCLQQAGRSEERRCRFCKCEWDTPWEKVLAGPVLPPADPIMVVTLGSVVHKVRVRPGPEGQKAFQLDIRRLFNIPSGIEFDVTFRCKAPCTSDTIQLEGMNTYHAATHCASLMAAQRMATATADAPSHPHPHPAAPLPPAGTAPPTGTGAWSFSVPLLPQRASQPAISSTGWVGSSPRIPALPSPLPQAAQADAPHEGMTTRNARCRSISSSLFLPTSAPIPAHLHSAPRTVLSALKGPTQAAAAPPHSSVPEPQPVPSAGEEAGGCTAADSAHRRQLRRAAHRAHEDTTSAVGLAGGMAGVPPRGGRAQGSGTVQQQDLGEGPFCGARPRSGAVMSVGAKLLASSTGSALMDDEMLGLGGMEGGGVQQPAAIGSLSPVARPLKLRRSPRNLSTGEL